MASLTPSPHFATGPARAGEGRFQLVDEWWAALLTQNHRTRKTSVGAAGDAICEERRPPHRLSIGRGRTDRRRGDSARPLEHGVRRLPARGARPGAQLTSFARVISFDKRGTGSDQVQGAPSLEERMDDVRAVMDAVGSKCAALVGTADGGSMSLLFAATYPERVFALALLRAKPRFVWAPDFPWAPRAEDYDREQTSSCVAVRPRRSRKDTRGLRGRKRSGAVVS